MAKKNTKNFAEPKLTSHELLELHKSSFLIELVVNTFDLPHPITEVDVQDTFDTGSMDKATIKTIVRWYNLRIAEEKELKKTEIEFIIAKLGKEDYETLRQHIIDEEE